MEIVRRKDRRICDRGLTHCESKRAAGDCGAQRTGGDVANDELHATLHRGPLALQHFGRVSSATCHTGLPSAHTRCDGPEWTLSTRPFTGEDPPSEEGASAHANSTTLTTRSRAVRSAEIDT